MLALDTKYFCSFMCDWRELEKNLAMYNKTMGGNIRLDVFAWINIRSVMLFITVGIYRILWWQPKLCCGPLLPKTDRCFVCLIIITQGMVHTPHMRLMFARMGSIACPPDLCFISRILGGEDSCVIF